MKIMNLSETDSAKNQLQELLIFLDTKLQELGFSLNFTDDSGRHHRNYQRSSPLGHEYLNFYLSQNLAGTLFLQWECGLSCHSIERLIAEAHKEPFAEEETPTTATIGLMYPDLRPELRHGNMQFDTDKTIDAIVQEFLDEFTGFYLPYLKQFQTLEDVFAAMPLTGKNAPMFFGMSVHPRVIRAYIIFLTKNKENFETFVAKDLIDIKSKFSDIDIGNYNFHINFLKGKYD